MAGTSYICINVFIWTMVLYDLKDGIGWVAWLWMLVLASCKPSASRLNDEKVDSLNCLSYEMRYKNLEEASRLADQAWKLAVEGGSAKKAEALNNRGFCAFMRMDFERAASLYKRATDAGRNEIERLVADVGMMKICQRTSMNKEFYDYRNSALNRIRRIREEGRLQDERLQKRFDYALSEFYIVSGVYYYYLDQEAEALASIDSIPLSSLRNDRGQWLYYMYMRGSGGMYQAPTREETVLGEFSYLVECLQASSDSGYIYFEANALQAMAEMLNFRRNRQLLVRERAGLLRMVNPEELPVDSLPLRFARHALKLFKEYGDWYQISGTYRTIATYYNYSGQSEKALPNLQTALDYVNLHHERYYHCEDTTDRLRTFIPNAASSIELKWINEEGIKTVPEWVARLREQLSRSYSALGMKAESDYNRNIYLDILDYTRQDKELESRYVALEREGRQLNVLLVMVIGGLFAFACLFVVLNRYWRKKNLAYVERLKQVLLLCQHITGSVPADAVSQDEVALAVSETLRKGLDAMFGVSDLQICLADMDGEEAVPDDDRTVRSFALVSPGKTVQVGTLRLFLSAALHKEDMALLNLLLPYVAWTIENGLNLVSLDDEKKQLEKEQYIHRQHLIDNKCRNEVKKACLSIVTGILPFIDRMVNDIRKLRTEALRQNDEVSRMRLDYIGELADKINEYNDILALWIKLRQGTLSLKIENFALRDLFAVAAKGRRSFEMKHLQLVVKDTDAVVKADKALTLFMINTLADNARKYTQEGGHVELKADEGENYVEVSVTDDGPGLSESDIHRILDEKVYDSSVIGMDTASDVSQLHKQKGHGFGLMNCKGIIEKYRKTNKVFDVCLFRIESAPGKGSRFYFRLPKGISRALLAAGMVCAVGLGACSKATSGTVSAAADPLHVSHYDSLLAIANDYANWVYDCNVNGDYQTAIRLADSVLYFMNTHYLEYSGRKSPLLSLYDTDEAGELTWLANRFDTDYYILLDVRNEAAVASLALKDFRRYRYNNAAYVSLYKRLSRDSSLEEYCLQMRQSAGNKLIALSIFVIIVLGCFIAYYVLYFRRRFRYRYNMEQVFAVNKAVFSASLNAEGNNVASDVLDAMFVEMNELLPLENLALAVMDEETHSLRFTCRQKADGEDWEEYLRKCYKTGKPSWVREGGWSCLPLWIEAGGDSRCIGVLALKAERSDIREEDRLLVELVCNYLAVILYNTIVQVSRKCRDIELAQDEARRVLFEENQLHVQNMVLDNCLSTIKHETVYYPNRILQMVNRLGEMDGMEKKAVLDDMAELVEYYKDIFTLLASCAARQLEEVTFRRMEVDMKALADEGMKYFSKLMRKQDFAVELTVESQPLCATGDPVLLLFLLQNLIDEAVRVRMPGHLKLIIRQDGDFVRTDFIDSRREMTPEELNGLFYPDKRRMCGGADGMTLTGTEYLVCKQIVRDHDEFAGKRGCRINACRAEGGGFAVWFTVPFRRKNK